MKSYRRMIPGLEEEVIKVSEDPNEPIDVSGDPEDTSYAVESFEDYMEFMKRVKVFPHRHNRIHNTRNRF